MARAERQMLESVTGLADQLEKTAAKIDHRFQERVRTLESLLRIAEERIGLMSLSIPDADEAKPDESPTNQTTLIAISGRFQEQSTTPATDPPPSATRLESPTPAIVAAYAAMTPSDDSQSLEQRIVQQATANAAAITITDPPSPPLGDDEYAVFDAEISTLRSRVHELATQDRRPIDIAESLGLSLGEVELILNIDQFAATRI